MLIEFWAATEIRFRVPFRVFSISFTVTLHQIETCFEIILSFNFDSLQRRCRRRLRARPVALDFGCQCSSLLCFNFYHQASCVDRGHHYRK